MVTGVMEDIKNSAIPYTDLLLRIEGVTEFNGSLGMDRYNNAGATTAFLMMKPGADLRPKTDDIATYMNAVSYTHLCIVAVVDGSEHEGDLLGVAFV